MSNEIPLKSDVTRLFNIKDVMLRLTALTPKSLPARMLKLTNELGELAGAVDILEENAGTKYRNAKDPVGDVLEEALDVLIVDLSLIIQFAQDRGFTIHQVLDVAERKLAKWEHVLELDDESADS